MHKARKIRSFSAEFWVITGTEIKTILAVLKLLLWSLVANRILNQIFHMILYIFVHILACHICRIKTCDVF